MKYNFALEGLELPEPLKDSIQAATRYGGMYVSKHASKKVASLKQNITPTSFRCHSTVYILSGTTQLV